MSKFQEASCEFEGRTWTFVPLDRTDVEGKYENFLFRAAMEHAENIKPDNPKLDEDGMQLYAELRAQAKDDFFKNRYSYGGDIFLASLLDDELLAEAMLFMLKPEQPDAKREIVKRMIDTYDPKADTLCEPIRAFREAAGFLAPAAKELPSKSGDEKNEKTSSKPS